MSRASGRRRPASRRGGPQKRGGINWIWVIAGAGGAVIVIGLVLSVIRQTTVIAGVQSYGPIPGGVHVAGNVDYPQQPPVGGQHAASWQNCGIYNAAVPEELAVHSLEHGAVWLTYRPDLPADQVEQLRRLARGRNYTLLSPYPDQATPIAISAWGFQLMVDQAGDARLTQFIDKYRQGPQTPEPGAACIGGVGTPDER